MRYAKAAGELKYLSGESCPDKFFEGLGVLRTSRCAGYPEWFAKSPLAGGSLDELYRSLPALTQPGDHPASPGSVLLSWYCVLPPQHWAWDWRTCEDILWVRRGAGRNFPGTAWESVFAGQGREAGNLPIPSLKEQHRVFWAGKLNSLHQKNPKPGINFGRRVLYFTNSSCIWTGSVWLC